MKTFGPALVEELTGFRVALRDGGIPAAVVTCPEGHTFTSRLPLTPRWELVARETNPVVTALMPGNWYNPREAKTMEDEYTQFEWTIVDGALRREFATVRNWTDVHVNAAIAKCDGLALTVSGEGIGNGLGLRVVVKGAKLVLDGTYELRLPQPATACDALTGEVVGRGERMTVDLAASSTTLLTLEQTR